MGKYLCSLLSIALICSCASLSEPNSQNQADNLDEMIGAELAITENFINKGNGEKAWQTIRPLLDQYSERAEVLTLAGLSLLALQNNKRAEQLLLQAYEKKPTPSIGLNLSSAHIAQGHYEAAEALLKQLIVSKEPYSFKERFWHNLALIYERQGDETKAIATYKQAIKENPTFYLSHLHLGKLYSKQGTNPKLAHHYYQLAHRFCPECYEPIAHLAQNAMDNDRFHIAIELLQTYLRNEESSAESRQQAQIKLHEAKAMHANQAMHKDLLPLSSR